MINLHNGDAMAIAAKRARIPGEHLPFRESLVVGPIPPAEKWIAVRARFLSHRYGEELLRASNALFEQQQALTAAASHDEVVLWFEHDLFCLINLLYLLQRFDRRVSIIWCPDPLAESDDAALMKLFQSRNPLTPAMHEAARTAWKAFASSDPRSLNRLIATENRDFPFLRDGLTLHASRFPSTRNGLGSVENRLLILIAGGATEFATLFGRFDETPPRLGFGDAEVLAALRDLANRDVPLATITEAEGTPPKAIFALTPAGENVMSASVNDLKINTPDAWLGGVHLTAENTFRWDEQQKRIL